MRRGVTLLEVLVALVLLEFGMLALMVTSAVAARELGVANRRMRAQWLAADRVERLRASACEAAQSGQATAPGAMSESWNVQVVGARRIVTDSIEIPLPNSRRESVVVRAWLLCLG
jgi:Tfp pilus assembly protein PilV